MFHPLVVEARERDLHDHFLQSDQSPIAGPLTRHAHDLCWSMVAHLEPLWDAKKKVLSRELTREESAFITNERLLCRIDYRYWAERYAVVLKETQDEAPLFPLWKSQDLFLARVADLEFRRWNEGHPDGLLFNVLKARQLGISTATQSIGAHRTTTTGALRGLVAADVEEQSRYMFSMGEGIIEHLPWWLAPPVRFHERKEYWESEAGASIRAAWGKSSRGGLADRKKAKGNIGRGKTHGFVHLSELSTWERPEQIDDALLPSIPTTPKSFAVFESTAKGRLDWWHHQWLKTAQKLGRFTNIFIPWYIEPEKYWLPAPLGWEPSTSTKQHMARVEESSPRYCLGKTVRLTREQAYWYEQTRATFDAQDSGGAQFGADGSRLPTFYEEYPADEFEAFQHAGRSVFGTKFLDQLRGAMKRPVDFAYIEPASDIAQLKQFEREAQARLEKEAAEEADRRKSQGIGTPL